MLNKKYYWDAHNYFKMKYLIRVIERKKLDEFLLLELKHYLEPGRDPAQ